MFSLSLYEVFADLPAHITLFIVHLLSRPKSRRSETPTICQMHGLEALTTMPCLTQDSSTLQSGRTFYTVRCDVGVPTFHSYAVGR
jgi:hypothetical protein